MNQTHCCRHPLCELLLRTATVIFLSATATAHAATDGLAISGAPPGRATMGQAYYFSPTVSNPAKLALHFGIWNKPAWATFNYSTGQLQGTPTAANVGTVNYVTIVVTDGVDKAYLPFYVTVFPPAADKPAISGSPSTHATVGQPYSFKPTVSNPAKLALHFGIWNKPAWATFNYSTGQLQGTPTAASAGTVSYVTILVTDGVDKAYLPAFYLNVKAATSTADNPVISGTPPINDVAGSPYSFQPSASGPSGMTLAFSVQNKPAWASFSIATGLLSGTPASTQTGTYSNIVISVSDGQASSALQPFAITVTAPAATTGSATVSLSPPTQNTDGSPLTDLAGVTIYYGTSPTNLSQTVQV